MFLNMFGFIYSNSHILSNLHKFLFLADELFKLCYTLYLVWLLKAF